MEGEKRMRFENLTDCEQLVMKTVWDAERELGLMDITQRVNGAYDKDWKPQTVSTFLARLVGKGYLKHYRQGRIFYYQILVPRKAYVGELADAFVEFWNRGNADEFLAALLEERVLREDEAERIQRLVSGQ